MGKHLVIVESPAKAKTIARFLGEDFVVAPSIGHIRDLPESAADIPASHKGVAWARLGVDVENDFQPLYVVPAEKQEQVKKLRSLLVGSDTLYLATDEDREGESISWHLLQVLAPKVPVLRLVFHEITQEAIQQSLQNARSIDEDLVKAQEARRILDRLFGYEVSPLLWKKIRPKLSAGRVQSVAVRLLVDRELARMGFHKAAYASLRATFAVKKDVFTAQLYEVGRRPVAGRADFDPGTGKLKAGSHTTVLNLAAIERLVKRIQPKQARVESVDEKPFIEKPSSPFTTSTLQQEANRRFHWSAQRIMQVAQRLYENGWITYMRTDSTTLSDEAISAARSVILEQYGQDFLPAQPRVYKTQSKAAQEAHEAIRPAGNVFKAISEAEAQLAPDEARLYDLIWKRTVASQMLDARGTRVRIQVIQDDARFQATGRTIDFPGFRRAYVETADEAMDRDESTLILPRVVADQALRATEYLPQEHETQPPPRLTEAGLVKELEARGIGRPSTYASIIETIQARKYVFRKGNSLVPTFTAFAVVRLLESTLADLVDYAFTARMEDDLDQIAIGRLDPVAYLKGFYTGEVNGGLRSRLEQALQQVDAREICSITIPGKIGEDAVVVRVGRYGPFLLAGDQRVDLPEDTPPDEMNAEQASILLEAKGHWPRELGSNPENGLPIAVMDGPYGFYVQEGIPTTGRKKIKPRRVSLPKGLDPETLDHATALRLLGLPRDLGAHPTSGEPVQAATGRFGPYVRCGTQSRSISDPLRILDINLNEAVTLLETPKARGQARAAASQGREIGMHPQTGALIRLLSGRYGPYVSDGTTNASLPRSLQSSDLDLDRAVELLAERASRPAQPRKARSMGRRATGTPAHPITRAPVKEAAQRERVQAPELPSSAKPATKAPKSNAKPQKASSRAPKASATAKKARAPKARAKAVSKIRKAKG